LVIFLFDLPISIRPRSGLKGSDRWLTERFHRFGQQRQRKGELLISRNETRLTPHGQRCFDSS
ncbi:hypothetical protein, partial [Vibrio parahaemolyticus]|uniref:hypothetical protein n=1 Tax=Vibrio parahaemolyticus TaxID=670 RepID=UPI0023629475